MSIAVANFIEALSAHYPIKHDSDEREDAWVNSMIGALRGFDGIVLNEVSDEIIRTRKYRNFPLLSEILDACDKVKKRREHAARAATLPPMRTPSKETDEWSEERQALADDLMRTTLGRQACKENWQLAMWHFCRKWRRAPNERHEIEQCKRTSREHDDLYKNILTNSIELNWMKNPVLSMAEAINRDREKIARGEPLRK